MNGPLVQQVQQSSSAASAASIRPLSPLRPSAPPPPTIESPDIKVNGRGGGSSSNRSADAIEAIDAGLGGRSGGCGAPTTEIDTEDNLSVGDVNDELKPSVPVQPEVEDSDTEMTVAPSGGIDASEAAASIAIPIKVKQEVKNGGYSEVQQPPSVSAKNGLHLLTEGIDRLAENHRLKPPAAPLQPAGSALPPSPKRPSRLGLLCDAAFLSDDEAYLKSSTDDIIKDIKFRSRSLDSPMKKGTESNK